MKDIKIYVPYDKFIGQSLGEANNLRKARFNITRQISGPTIPAIMRNYEKAAAYDNYAIVEVDIHNRSFKELPATIKKTKFNPMNFKSVIRANEYSATTPDGIYFSMAGKVKEKIFCTEITHIRASNCYNLRLFLYSDQFKDKARYDYVLPANPSYQINDLGLRWSIPC